MKHLLPRVRILIILGFVILGGGVVAWWITETLTDRAWKMAYLNHMASMVKSYAKYAEIPPKGQWVRDKNGKTCFSLINLDKGRLAMDHALAYMGIDLSVAAEVLYRGNGAVCIDPECKTVVAGTKLHDPKTGKRGALIIKQETSILYRLKGYSSMVWMLTLLLVGVSSFLLGYFLLYLWELKPFLNIIGELERMAPILRDTNNPKKPETAMEVLVRLRKAYENEKRRRRRLEHQVHDIHSNLLSAQENLIRSEKLASVGVLAAGLAHEIGNPIGIIMGLSELLSSGDMSDEESREYAESILKSAKRVHHVIRELLAFARPTKEEGEHAEVNSVIKDAVSLMQPQSSFKHIVLQTRLADRPVFAEIKPSHLQQVIVNLMLNAADAMNGRGIIDVKVRTKDGRVAISVLDSGPGIPRDILPKIWEPFFTTKDVGKGTGLGLPMSLKIVNAYGGDIRVETASKKGTIFTIYLWEVE